MYLKGYDCPAQSKRRAYPKEQLPLSPKAKRRRLVDNKQQAPDQVKAPNENSYIQKEPTDRGGKNRRARERRSQQSFHQPQEIFTRATCCKICNLKF